VCFVIEGASNEHVEVGIARLPCGSDKIGALDGAKLWADEDGGALLGLAFQVAPFGAD